MLKVRLVLRAKEDLPKRGYKKHDTCTLINNIFSEDNGVAFWSIDDGWEVIHMELLEYKLIKQD